MICEYCVFVGGNPGWMDISRDVGITGSQVQWEETQTVVDQGHCVTMCWEGRAKLFFKVFGGHMSFFGGH